MKLVFPVTMTIKNMKHRFRCREKFRERRKFFEKNGGVRIGAQAATHINLKTFFFFSVHGARLGHETQIMNGRISDIGLAAAIKSNLEFPGKILADRMAQEMFKDGLGVRCDI